MTAIAIAIATIAAISYNLFQFPIMLTFSSISLFESLT